MQNSYFRQKSQSLILSVLLHVLLFLLLLFFLKMRHELAPFDSEQVERRSTPAQVSFEKRKPVSPPAIQPPAQAAPLPAAPPVQAQQAVQEEPAQEPIQEQVQVAPLSEAPSGGPETADTAQPAGQGAGTAAAPAQEDTSQPYGGGMRRGGRRGRSSITGQEFMNAFRQSIEKDRTARPYPSAPGSGSGSGTAPQHVQERLDEWLQMNYLQSITKALARASKLYSKYIKPEENFEKTVKIEIVLEKNGTLGEMSSKLTGIAEVDEFLMKVFKAADFPPIPQRFNKDQFIFPIKINVKLNRDGFYKLSVE